VNRKYRVGQTEHVLCTPYMTVYTVMTVYILGGFAGIITYNIHMVLTNPNCKQPVMEVLSHAMHL
jgi:hypothetical protein